MTLGAALYDAFGKTYILNLKKSLDRKLSMEDIKNKIPEDWDIIVLGSMFQTYPYTGDVDYTPNLLHTPGCHACAINHTVYHDIIAQSAPITNVVGDHLNDHLRSLGKKIYSVYPDICLQDRSFVTTC